MKFHNILNHYQEKLGPYLKNWRFSDFLKKCNILPLHTGARGPTVAPKLFMKCLFIVYSFCRLAVFSVLVSMTQFHFQI